MINGYSTNRRRSDPVSPEIIDRILIGVCAAIWLVWIGMSVAATVALMDLGRGFRTMTRNPHATWVLYAVIIVSALIIAGAIPVLLRARRMAATEPGTWSLGAPARGGQAARPWSTVTRPTSGPATVFEQAAGAPWQANRIWLRGTVMLAGAMGVALIAVATATYLMAVGHDGASWICYGLAGLVTTTMPAIDLFNARQLRRVLATQ